jgi:hypothetical protein
MLWNELTFGVEIECFAPNGVDPVAVLRNAGVDCLSYSGYTHTTIPQWKVVTDGSLRNMSRTPMSGWEIVSPVLSGEAGIAQVRAVMVAIHAAGFKVNATCGMHVHVGVGGASVAQVKNLAKMYLKYSGCFDAVLPASRRGVANYYCRNNRQALFASYTNEQIEARFRNVRSLGQISTLMSGVDIEAAVNARSSERYFAFNMLSYVQHGTVEFRQHSGTTDAEKAVNWVRLVTGFVAAAFSLNHIKMDCSASRDGEMLFAKFLRKTDRSGARFFRARRAALHTATAA